MNREDTIRIAREAGMEQDGDNFFSPMGEEMDVHISDLERFFHAAYAAGAAAERKAMMQLFTDPENQPTQHGTVTVEYMQREIAAEREACAKVCDETLAQHYMKQTIPARDEALFFAACADCAAAIRSRGQA